MDGRVRELPCRRHPSDPGPAPPPQAPGRLGSRGPPRQAPRGPSRLQSETSPRHAPPLPEPASFSPRSPWAESGWVWEGSGVFSTSLNFPSERRGLSLPPQHSVLPAPGGLVPPEPKGGGDLTTLAGPHLALLCVTTTVRGGAQVPWVGCDSDGGHSADPTVAKPRSPPPLPWPLLPQHSASQGVTLSLPPNTPLLPVGLVLCWGTTPVEFRATERGA